MNAERIANSSVVDISSIRGSVRGPGRSPSIAGSPAELRAQWRRASLEAGWSFPGDWWVPAVEAVAEAIFGGLDPVPGANRLGMARAESGVPMNEALADIESLWRVAGAHVAPSAGSLSAVIHAVAVGWAERAEIPTGGTPCEDPLTLLATPEYLATRLGEIYRGAEFDGTTVAETHALVVVSLIDAGDDVVPPARNTWDAPMQMVLLSEAMHAVFSAGETIAGVRGNTAVALVRRGANLGTRVGALREHIEHERLSASGPRRPSVGVWVEGLPPSLRNAVALLKELRR